MVTIPQTSFCMVSAERSHCRSLMWPLYWKFLACSVISWTLNGAFIEAMVDGTAMRGANERIRKLKKGSSTEPERCN